MLLGALGLEAYGVRAIRVVLKECWREKIPATNALLFFQRTWYCQMTRGVIGRLLEMANVENGDLPKLLHPINFERLGVAKNGVEI